MFWDLEIATDHLISAKWLNLKIVNQKKRTYWIVDFAIPADHWVKLKEIEKRDKYRHLAQEMKKSYRTWKW